MAPSIGKISGFPEWLPEERAVEEEIIRRIREIYVSHGFTSMETPAVELLSTLRSQGVVDKELYVLRRAQALDEEEADLALHFDLTVPFARYVAQHYNNLHFPFRRYCLQKVWRGDRPQRGRYREFYQFDIDIVCREEVPLACDAEVVTVMVKAFRALELGDFQLRMNNRKLLLGFYQSLGLDETKAREVVVVVDKLDKIGVKGVFSELSETLALSRDISQKIVEMAELRLSPVEFKGRVESLGISNEQFTKGVDEIESVLRLVPGDLQRHIQVDLSLARGLGYYTGTIFEILLSNYLDFGSVAGGGRYENLTGQFLKHELPAVGGSIGLTRLMGLILERGLFEATKSCPSKVLVTVYNEEQRNICNERAEELRAVGVPCEVFYKTAKLGKQIEYAAAKGINFVLFVQESGKTEVKNLHSKEQLEVEDIPTWATETFKH
jgi:histidyl-tRNA synthetase